MQSISNVLFETPWWLPTLIAAIGIAIFISANRRQQWARRKRGAAIVGLAALLVLVSYFVDTPKEKAVAKTRQLVQAVVKRDAKTMNAILGPRAEVTDSTNRTIFHSPETIVAAALSAADLYGLDSATIVNLDAKQDAAGILIGLKVFARSTKDRGSISTYQLTWQEDEDGWHLTTIQVLTIDNTNSADILSTLPLLTR